MTDLLDPNRECHCVLCEPEGRSADRSADCSAHCSADRTAGVVAEHGWSATGIASANGIPGWAFTIGLWHTLGSPEVAMFGLRLTDMQNWVNDVARQIRDGDPLTTDDRPRHDVLPGGFPVLVRPVHESWYEDLFGTAIRFYRRPPLPITQVVWPDRQGRFPWEDGAGDNCRANQPWLWLPRDQQPPGLWRDIGTLLEWPFADSPIRTTVYTTTRVVAGDEPVRGAYRHAEGDWWFLDGLDVTSDVVAPVHLHELYARRPEIVAVAHLAPGREAWQQPDGTWLETDAEPLR